MINWAAHQSALNEDKGEASGKDIGSPSGPDRRKIAGLAKREEDRGGEHHPGTKENGESDATGGSSPSKDNPERRGKEN